MQEWYLVWLLVVQQSDGSVEFNMHKELISEGYEQCIEQLALKDSLLTDEEFLAPDMSHIIFCKAVDNDNK